MRRRPELDGETEFNISLPAAVLITIGVAIADYLINPIRRFGTWCAEQWREYID